MNAYTFRRTDAWREQTGQKGRPARCTVNFNEYCISLSKQLSAMLGVKSGGYVAFTCDEDCPSHIYIRPAEYPDDDRIIQHKLSSAGRNKTVLRCFNRAVIEYMFELTRATKSCTCYVEQKPTSIDGKNHYRIMLHCPIRVV